MGGDIRLIGAMSGTSTDGVDAVAITATTAGSNGLANLQFQKLVSVDFSSELRQCLLQLQDPGFVYLEGQDPFEMLALARRDLSDVYTHAVKQLLDSLGWQADSVMACGVHGQTIRHCPEQGYTFQVIDANRVSEATGLKVISDFRSADVAAGGQGAPLVPAFHQAWLKGRSAIDSSCCTAILNLGGFSNLTVLDAQGEVVAGGDCGPANTWLDWCTRLHWNKPFDAEGQLAHRGSVLSALLDQLMAHPYFQKAWPASTGREDFSEQWLTQALSDFVDVRPEDLLATLVEMAAHCVGRCLEGRQGVVYVCGGGTANTTLLCRIESVLGDGWLVRKFDCLGLGPQAVEGAAFAWLAGCHQLGLAGNVPVVTGATKAAVLGLSTGR